MTAQVEQDDRAGAGLLRLERLVDDDADGVGRLGRGQDPSARAKRTPDSNVRRWWTAWASMRPSSLTRLTRGAMPW